MQLLTVICASYGGAHLLTRTRASYGVVLDASYAHLPART